MAGRSNPRRRISQQELAWRQALKQGVLLVVTRRLANIRSRWKNTTCLCTPHPNTPNPERPKSWHWQWNAVPF